MANKSAMAQKKTVVKEIADKIANSASVLVWEYKKLDVSTIQKIKNELEEAGANTKVYKNTLAKIALKEKGFEDLAKHLVGQNAFAFASADDEVATARIIFKHMEKNDGIVLKAGIFEGQIIDKLKLTELAQLPSRDGLLSMLLSALQGNTRNLAYALSQIAEKLPAGDAPKKEAAPKEEAKTEEKVEEAKPAEETKPEETKKEEVASTEAPE